MKRIIPYILVLITFFTSNAQNREVDALDSCQNDFYFYYLYPMFGKDFVKRHFSLDKEKSYFNYIDATTKAYYWKVGLKESDTINGSPNQYCMVLKITHQKYELGSIRIDCHYYDNLVRSEKIAKDELYLILKPYLKVINGKALGLEPILRIAKDKGYSKITEWDIDYEKNIKNNEYKWLFPRLIWTLKEYTKEDKLSYFKVIQINAKNGKVIREYKEYNL